MGMDAGLAVRSLVVAAFSVAVVLVANWSVARLGRPIAPASRGSAARALAATILWTGLMIMAGLLAMRYIERLSSPVAGYLVYALAVGLLTVARALLYRRAEEQRRAETGLNPDNTPVRRALTGLTYLLAAATLYLLFCAVTGRSVNLVLLVPLAVGALLPDLDSRSMPIGRLLRPPSRRLEDRPGPRQGWHSLGAALVAAIIASPLIPVAGWEPWVMISLGFVAHLLREMLEPEGLMLFWPLSRTRYYLFSGWLVRPGSQGERRLLIALFLTSLGLLLIVQLRPVPSPPAASPPDAPLEEVLAPYQAIRGRNLVFADVEGVWQITGRRVSARYEIVGAMDQSLILHDRYTGELFSGGRSASDQLYLDQVSFLTGAEVRIKPVEVRLHEVRVAEALPVVYQMQREPGLQHIFVSGDLVIAVPDEQAERALSRGYPQTRLLTIQDQGGGHYRVRYLTASELIELAGVRVISADLVIVATSVVAASSPTATPLPTPPAGPEGKDREGEPKGQGSSEGKP